MSNPTEFSAATDPLLSLQVTREMSHLLPVLAIEGKLTDAGWARIARACAEMDGPLRLLDFSGVTHCQTNSDDAASFGRLLARQTAATGEQPCHVLIAPGDMIFALCRVIQMNLDMARMTASVSRSVAAATRWMEQENLLPEPPKP